MSILEGSFIPKPLQFWPFGSIHFHQKHSKTPKKTFEKIFNLKNISSTFQAFLLNKCIPRPPKECFLVGFMYLKTSKKHSCGCPGTWTKKRTSPNKKRRPFRTPLEQFAGPLELTTRRSKGSGNLGLFGKFVFLGLVFFFFFFFFKYFMFFFLCFFFKWFFFNVFFCNVFFPFSLVFWVIRKKPLFLSWFWISAFLVFEPKKNLVSDFVLCFSFFFSGLSVFFFFYFCFFFLRLS